MIVIDIIKVIKDIGEVARKSDNIDLYRQILDMQKEVMDLLELNRDLKRKIEQMEDNKTITRNLVVRGDIYYYKTEDGKEDGPFCTGCWDKDNKLIRLHAVGQVEAGYRRDCPVCKNLAIDRQMI